MLVGTDDLDQRDELELVVGIEDFNPRLANLEIFNLDNDRGIGFRVGERRHHVRRR